MCELLQMFLQNEKSLFLKSMQKDGTAITFEELLSNIRKVKGCQSLTVSKRIQELLLENNILKKTPNDNFYVNESYHFESNPDLKGWNIAYYKRDIPEEFKRYLKAVCNDESVLGSIRSAMHIEDKPENFSEIEILRRLADEIVTNDKVLTKNALTFLEYWKNNYKNNKGY